MKVKNAIHNFKSHFILKMMENRTYYFTYPITRKLNNTFDKERLLATKQLRIQVTFYRKYITPVLLISINSKSEVGF